MEKETSPQDNRGKSTYTVEEIASKLDISMKSAYRLIRSGQFRYVRAGRMIRISKDSFDQWLNP